MRFHVLSLPHTQTTKKYSWCAYTEKVRKFSNMMMSLGHEVFLYASEDNEAECTEFISIVSKYEQEEWFGHLNWELDLFPADGWEVDKPWWRITNSRAIREISKRIEPTDFVCAIMGRCHAQVMDAFPEHVNVEWGIGYEGVYSINRVFESYAWMHHVYGIRRESNGSASDTVIPNFFELEDFSLGDGDGGYYLFLGRVVLRKGPHIAAQICNQIDEKLIVAGQGGKPMPDGSLLGLDNVIIEGNYEYIGTVDPIRRNEILGGAKAIFVPTIYIEPFGGVAVEAMLCGTPVICTDWGAFTETVIDEVTGFRCNTIDEFREAALRAGELDRTEIREYAKKFSTDNVRWQYEKYFNRIKLRR